MPTLIKPILCVSTLLAVVAQAPAAMAASEEVFSITQLDNGYLRLNTKSGEVSLCAEKSGRLVCQVADDERRSFRAEIDALKERVTALEEKSGIAKTTSKPRSFADERKDMEQALDLGEFALRRFFDVIQDIEKEAEKKGMTE